MLLALMMTLAFAGEVGGGRSGPHERPPARGAFRTVAAGALVGVAGLVTTGVGVGLTYRNYRIPLVRFDDQAPTAFYTGPLAVVYSGFGLLVVGAPMMAGGALRARAVLPAPEVSVVPGVLAIGAAGLAVPAAFGPAGVLTAGGLVVTAYALSAVEWRHVRRGGRHPVAVHVVPTPTGVALAGGW